MMTVILADHITLFPARYIRLARTANKQPTTATASQQTRNVLTSSIAHLPFFVASAPSAARIAWMTSSTIRVFIVRPSVASDTTTIGHATPEGKKNGPKTGGRLT